MSPTKQAKKQPAPSVKPARKPRTIDPTKKRLDTVLALSLHARIAAYKQAHSLTWPQAIERLLTTSDHVGAADTIVVELDDPLKRRGQRGTALLAVSQAVKALMAANEALRKTHPGQRPDALVYLSQNEIERRTKADNRTIQAYWKAHKREIDQHNFDMGFESMVDGREWNKRRGMQKDKV